jgi:hypothetical protein
MKIIKNDEESYFFEKCSNLDYYRGMLSFQTTIIISIISFILIYFINNWIYITTRIRIITINITINIIIFWIISMTIWRYQLYIIYDKPIIKQISDLCRDDNIYKN